VSKIIIGSKAPERNLLEVEYDMTFSFIKIINNNQFHCKIDLIIDDAVTQTFCLKPFETHRRALEGIRRGGRVRFRTAFRSHFGFLHPDVYERQCTTAFVKHAQGLNRSR